MVRVRVMSLIAASERAIHSGNYQSGYWTLVKALQCAYRLGDIEGCALIEALAEAELGYIDLFAPHHHLSSRFAGEVHIINKYAMLRKWARTLALMLKNKHACEAYFAAKISKKDLTHAAS